MSGSHERSFLYVTTDSKGLISAQTSVLLNGATVTTILLFTQCTTVCPAIEVSGKSHASENSAPLIDSNKLIVVSYYVKVQKSSHLSIRGANIILKINESTLAEGTAKVEYTRAKLHS